MKIVYWCLGIFFTFMALLGALLPVLQAWFFWILAGVYFSKASPRFRHWFTHCWVYRKFLARFLEKEKSSASRTHQVTLPTANKII